LFHFFYIQFTSVLPFPIVESYQSRIYSVSIYTWDIYGFDMTQLWLKYGTM